MENNDSELNGNMTEKDKNDILESMRIIISEMIECNPSIYQSYDFDITVKQNVYENFDNILDYDEFEDIYNENYYEMFRENKNTNVVVRSYTYTYPSFVDYDSHIEYLCSLEQPEQRTDAWYQFRYNHITASNAWKCFGNEKSMNSIVYEKLKPLNVEKYKPSLSDSPLTWGQKFEPIS